VKLKRWCVTVMDNWTPTREFWSLGGAMAHFAEHQPASYLYHWSPALGGWSKVVFPSIADPK